MNASYWDQLFGKNFTVYGESKMIEVKKSYVVELSENTKVIEALETISEETDVPVKGIIDLLTGFCWDEEEGGELNEEVSRRGL